MYIYIYGFIIVLYDFCYKLLGVLRLQYDMLRFIYMCLYSLSTYQCEMFHVVLSMLNYL